MKRYLLLVIPLLFCFTHQAHAVGCTSTAYGTHITCVKASAVSTGHTCGAAASGVITATNTGDMMVLYIDADGTSTVTSVTGGGVTWTQLGNLTQTVWNANASNTGIWIGTSANTSAMNITASGCGTVFEIAALELHSSAGTIAVDCSSSWQILVSGSNPSTSCNSTHTNGIGLSFVDWNNGATQGAGWTLISEAVENVMEAKSAPTATSVNGTWTAGPDNMISGTAVFTDGATVSVKRLRGAVISR